MAISICALSTVVLTVTRKGHSQPTAVAIQNSKDALLKVVENSPELPIKVAGNDNCPFRIIEATVKEMSGPDFSRLTGKATNQSVVVSVPQVKLINTSPQTVTSFVLVVRDPQSRTSRGFVQRKVSIRSGAVYLIERTHFVAPETETVATSDMPVRQIKSQPTLASDKYWLQFEGPIDQTFVTIGRVEFADGSVWKLQEGGDVK